MNEIEKNFHRRILVIDDNPAIHQDFEKVFRRQHQKNASISRTEAALFGETPSQTEAIDFQMDFASQGEAGLKFVQRAIQEQKPYSMAFVDVRMPPGWDGIETISQIWHEYPDLQVVLCTAYSDYSLDEILKKLGRSDRLVILKKPFDSIEVLQLAHALTEKWLLVQKVRERTDDLECRVAERTGELQTTNEKLRTEIAGRQQAEENFRQAQKMEAIGQLAGGVAHDFNNMLTVIRGYAQCLLVDETLEAKIREPLLQMDGAAERAANLTRQLLAFSHKQVLQPELLDLTETISHITKMLHRILGEDIALQIETEPNIPRVMADRAMIEQILLNLVVNARDAMPRGGRLLIRTAEVEFANDRECQDRQSCDGKLVCLTVNDSGCGIPPEIINRIFEPFFTTKEVGKGTGLGLATVYGIVKQHKGWIEVESTLARGATFKLFFPASKETVKHSVTPDLSRKATGGTESILLVEDEPALRRLTQSVLQSFGYRVITAVSGADALKVWPDHAAEIDLLLTDMVMPDGVSGRELAQRLQAEKSHLKVIFSSGYSLEMADKDNTLRVGENFLPKPYTPEKLALMVRGCLDNETATIPMLNRAEQL